MVMRMTTRKPATSPVRRSRALRRLSPATRQSPAAISSHGSPATASAHQALRQQLVSQHGFGKFIGVQDFLQPGIKKEPAQNHFQGPEPNKATAYPQVSLPKSQGEKAKRGKAKG